MSRRLLIFGTIILSLFLFSYSCEDHQQPGVPPSLMTLDTSPSGLKCQALFNLDVIELGNIPVTEYGMVVVGNNVGGQFSDTPTIDNKRVIFDLPFSAGPKKKVSDICSDHMSFRTYAILNNGAVVYGEIRTFSNI